MKGEYDVFLFCERCGEQWFQGHKCGYRMVVYEKIEEDDEASNSEDKDLENENTNIEEVDH